MHCNINQESHRTGAGKRRIQWLSTHMIAVDLNTGLVGRRMVGKVREMENEEMLSAIVLGGLEGQITASLP